MQNQKQWNTRTQQTLKRHIRRSVTLIPCANWDTVWLKRNQPKKVQKTSCRCTTMSLINRPAQHTMTFSIAQAAQQITRTFPTDHEIWTWEDLQAVVIDLFLTPTSTFADSYCNMSRHNQPWPCSPAWQDTTSHRRNIGGAAPTNTCRLTKLGMSQTRGPIDIIDSWDGNLWDSHARSLWQLVTNGCPYMVNQPVK